MRRSLYAVHPRAVDRRVEDVATIRHKHRTRRLQVPPAAVHHLPRCELRPSFMNAQRRALVSEI